MSSDTRRWTGSLARTKSKSIGPSSGYLVIPIHRHNPIRASLTLPQIRHQHRRSVNVQLSCRFLLVRDWLAPFERRSAESHLDQRTNIHISTDAPFLPDDRRSKHDEPEQVQYVNLFRLHMDGERRQRPHSYSNRIRSRLDGEHPQTPHACQRCRRASSNHRISLDGFAAWAWVITRTRKLSFPSDWGKEKLSNRLIRSKEVGHPIRQPAEHAARAASSDPICSISLGGATKKRGQADKEEARNRVSGRESSVEVV